MHRLVLPPALLALNPISLADDFTDLPIPVSVNLLWAVELRFFSSLYRSQVLIARIACIVIIIGIHGMVGVTADLCMQVLVLSLPRRGLAA
jgi:hypothetical protein